jgi:hypothetical protein
MRTVLVFAVALGACSRGVATSGPGDGVASADEPSPASPGPEPNEPASAPPVADASPAATASAALQCALDAPALAQYLHPEVPGRVPVRVRLPAAVTLASMPQASGASIEVVATDALLEVVSLRIDGDAATMRLQIPAEGVFGEVGCTRVNDLWRPTNVALAER